MRQRKPFPEAAVILLAGALAAVIALAGLTGCTYRNEEKNSRLKLIYVGSYFKIVEDTETGVQYIAKTGQSGICVMVNADGTPYTGGEHESEEKR